MLGSILLFVAPAAYQGLALYAAVRQALRVLRGRFPDQSPESAGVSVLKPLRGLDPNTREAFVSQAEQAFQPFEILFAAQSETDPATFEVRQLQARFPDHEIHLYSDLPETRNGKVGALIELGRHARYPIWIVNDSDILVTPQYLATVTAPLLDPEVGVVTCLYRARAHTLAAAWEALGIATDFMPSTLVAQAIGVREFGLGSTLAFRADDLEAIGGFATLADFIADDYQLAKRIVGLGKRVVLSTMVVETSLGDATWSGIWGHQLRWARTIRASKGAAYSGVFLTQAGVWMFLLFASRRWRLGTILGLLRVATAYVTARFVLADRFSQRLCWLAPLWDVYAFAIWVCAHLGRAVTWRGKPLRIDAHGRILDQA